MIDFLLPYALGLITGALLLTVTFTLKETENAPKKNRKPIPYAGPCTCTSAAACRCTCFRPYAGPCPESGKACKKRPLG